MPRPIKDIFAEAGDKRLALVKDESVYYIVLNTKENQIDQEFVSTYNKFLDQIEQDEDQVVMVTVGSGTKFFCGGYNSNPWLKNEAKCVLDLNAGDQLWNRLIQFGVPSMSVLNGTARAGGGFLALSHDQIVMRDDPSIHFAFPEIYLGFQIPYHLIKFIQHFVPNQVVQYWVSGGLLNPQQARAHCLVRDLYSTDEQLERIVQRFAKGHSFSEHQRQILTNQKRLLNRDLIKVMSNSEYYGVLTTGQFRKLEKQLARM